MSSRIPHMPCNFCERKDATIASLREEVERYRAVLEGAEYRNIDNLKNESVEKCRAIGAMAALLTVQLRTRLAVAEGKVEKALKIATMTNYYLEHIEEIQQILRGEP